MMMFFSRESLFHALHVGADPDPNRCGNLDGAPPPDYSKLNIDSGFSDLLQTQQSSNPKDTESPIGPLRTFFLELAQARRLSSWTGSGLLCCS